MQFFTYVSRFTTFRSRLTGLPAWVRGLLLLLALPGLLGVALSMLILVVSICTLFLLCLPVWRLAMAVYDRPAPLGERPVETPPMSPTPGRRHVDVTIIE